MVFVELVLVYSKLTELPWGIYSTFVVEARHGFNKQVGFTHTVTVAVTMVTSLPKTPMFFFKDQVKSLVLLLVLIPPIFLGLLYTIHVGGRAFFIYAWLFLAAVTFVRQHTAVYFLIVSDGPQGNSRPAEDHCIPCSCL